MDNWDRRPDGSLKKGGFLGVVNRPAGGVSTEYSIGMPIFGKETDVPSMVPTLTPHELYFLMTLPREQPIPDVVADKARRSAEIRMSTGQSPFAGDNESPSPTRGPGPWADEYVLPGDQPSRVLNMLLKSFRR